MTKPKLRKDHDKVVYFLRHIANLVAIVLAKTPLTPNMITVGGFFLFVPSICYAVLQPEIEWKWAALGLIGVYVIVDLADGNLARLTGKNSAFGSFLDRNLDRTFQALLFPSIVLSLYLQHQDITLLYWGMALLVGQNMSNVMGLLFEKELAFHPWRGAQDIQERFDQLEDKGLADHFYFNLITPRTLLFVLLFTARYAIAAALVLNKLEWFLMFFAVSSNIRWIGMFRVMVWYIAGADDKHHFIKSFRAPESEPQGAA